MSEDTRRPCNCGTRSQVIGDQFISGDPNGRVVMGNDFRFIDDELIIHRGYDGARACKTSKVSVETQKLLAEIERIEEINRTECLGNRRASRRSVDELTMITPSNIIPKNNAKDSIIQSITIRGESSVIGVQSLWDANSWQNDNPNVPNGKWLPTTMPYIYNFGSLGQFGESINVDVLFNDNNWKIIWAIVDSMGKRVKNKIVLNLEYKIDYYKDINSDFNSEAGIELIDIGDTLAGFYTKLKTSKTVSKKNNKVDIEYTIEWYPTVQTTTAPNIDLSRTIANLSSRRDVSSQERLNEILSVVSQSIDNTKLTIFIKYGSSLKKFNSIGSLLAININNN